MAEAQKIKQLEERVAILETLVMSCVAKNESSAATPTPRATIDGMLSPAATTVKTSEKDVSHLMNLPSELRTDILKRVLQPVVASEDYGLTPPLEVPLSIYTSRTRVPAVLHTNQVMRAESTRIFLGLARARIARLDLKTKEIKEKYQAALAARRGTGYNMRLTLMPMRENLVLKYETMAELDSSCRVLGEHLERK